MGEYRKALAATGSALVATGSTMLLGADWKVTVAAAVTTIWGAWQVYLVGNDPVA